MCKGSNYYLLFKYGYIALCFIIPIIYIMLKKKKKKRKKKANLRKEIIAIFIFLILFSMKFVVKYFDKGCLNCYINGVCQMKEKKEKPTTVNTTTTTTISTTTTETTTQAITNTPSYNKLSEPDGEKVVIGTSSKGYEIYTIDGITYIDGYIIVNKTYGIPKSFVPKNTYTSAEGVEKVCNKCINKQVYSAWSAMKADAAAVGLNLWIQSGYRPYVSQEKIYNSYVQRDGQEEADTYSARPGYSEHHTGECFDINNPSRTFNNSTEAKWIAQNCYKYGFIIRYPENKTNETGYMYESWHVRYVGAELANILYNNGDWITMEDYFGITSEYQA